MIPFRSKTWSVGAMLTAVLLCAAPARAQKTDGKVQLALSTPLVGYENYTVETSGADTKTSGIVWGLPGTRNSLGQPVVVLELGYGLGKMAVLGALMEVSGGSTKYEPPTGNDEDRQSFGFAAGPKLDLVFSSGETMRPYLGLTGGYAARWASANIDNAPNQESKATGFFATGRFGLHVFATKSFSIDPMFVFNYRKADLTEDFGLQPEDIESTVKGYEAGLALGFSGWM